MKKISLFLFISTFIFQSFSQTLEKDTILARDYLIKADEFSELSEFDSALEYIIKAQDIYRKYNSVKLIHETELEKAGIYIDKRELNIALKILSAGEKEVLKTYGENNELYAGYCNKIGLVYVYAGKYTDAKDLWIKALVIRKKLYGNKHVKVSDSYNNLGGLYTWTGDYYKSLKLHKNALKIREESLSENDLRIASSLMNIGSAYSKTGNPDLALNYYLRSLKIKKKHLKAMHSDFASIYNNLGVVYHILGEYDRSLTNYNNALLIRRKNLGEDHPETAGIYTNMAIVMNSKGEYNKALEYHGKALKVYEAKYGKEHPAVAKILQDIGIVHLNMGNIAKAVDYFNTSLEISKKIYGTWNDKTAKLYTAIGVILYEENKNTSALEYYFNALKILQNVFKSGNHPEIAETFQHIGIAYKDEKEYYQALDYYNKCLNVRLKVFGNKHPKTAHIYNLFASLHKAKKEYTTELKYLQKALAGNIENFNSQNVNINPDFNSETSFYFDQKILLKTINAKAEAFANLYLRTNNTDNLKESFKVYELSDLIIDRTKTSTSSKKDKIYLAENMSLIYEKAISVCMQLFKKTNESKYFYKAFAYSEKNKAGVLLEALSSTEAKRFAEIPDSVLNIENDLLADIAYFRKKISEDPDDLDSRTKLFSLKRKHESFIMMLENKYQKYYGLKYEPYSITIEDIQNLINENTLVLDYFSTELSKFIYIFMIRKNKADIRFIRKADNFDDKVLSFRKQFFSNTEDNMKAFTETGYALYKQLIPKVLENDTSIKQLLIIPDGNLGMIPFESLLTEEYTDHINKYENYPYLIKKYAVSYSYSASLFHKTFYKDSLDNIEITSMNDFLALAPVFDDDNQKGISLKTRSLLKKMDELSQINTRAHLLSGNYISHLPGSENEVKAIFYEFENKDKEALLKTNLEANEAFVKSEEFRNYKYIHIATHGFVNSENPDLSGILLAQDATGGNDGILYMGEIFNLKLNSELIVLSACETGLGKYERGEGVIGLTRALLYAGTKNIIVSLWQVSDESTEKMMINFYKDFLNNYDGNEEFRHSLRFAKLKLIEDSKYSHPFFWSPFILIGR